MDLDRNNRCFIRPPESNFQRMVTPQYVNVYNTSPLFNPRAALKFTSQFVAGTVDKRGTNICVTPPSHRADFDVLPNWYTSRFGFGGFSLAYRRVGVLETRIRGLRSLRPTVAIRQCPPLGRPDGFIQCVEVHRSHADVSVCPSSFCLSVKSGDRSIQSSWIFPCITHHA